MPMSLLAEQIDCVSLSYIAGNMSTGIVLDFYFTALGRLSNCTSFLVIPVKP
jgi:hypothetical protein